MDVPNRSQKRAASSDEGTLSNSEENLKKKRATAEGHSEVEHSLGALISAAVKSYMASSEAKSSESLLPPSSQARSLEGAASGGPSGVSQKKKAPTEGILNATTATVPFATEHGTSLAKQRDDEALNQLWEALDPIPDKEAYLEALERCPFLVETESPAIRFLRREDYDPWAGAKRLVAYWRERKDIFGSRAFLPMDLSGKGALSPEEVGLVNTAYFAVLPPDKDNHLVAYCDRERMDNEELYASPEIRLRTAFYWTQVLSENPTAQEEGVVCLNILNAPSFQRNQSILTAAFRLVHTAMPLRFYSFHMLNRPSNIRKRSLIETTLPLVMQVVGKYFWNITTIHIGEKDELFDILQKNRLEKESIPELLGGTWSYDQFGEWKQARVVLEQERQTVLQKHSAASVPWQVQAKLPAKVNGIEQPSPSLIPTNASFASSGNEVRESIPSPFQDTPESRKKALEELEDALGLIDDESKAALMEARELIPDLANKEADPIRFLRFEGYNTWAAASRLAKYWSKRKELFGKRAFLPMNQTGEGTLNRQDLAALSSGYIVFLQNDSAGRTVACVDSSRRDVEAPATRLRVAFYLANVMSENDMTQRDGGVVISILGVPKIDKVSPKLTSLLLDHFPCKLHMHHVVNYIDPDNKTTKKSYMETFVPLLMRVGGKLSSEKTIVHVGKTADELGNKLQAYEFKKETLPRCMGGEWRYSEFPEWQDLRMRYEWQLPAGVAHKDSGYELNHTAKQHCDLTEEEKTERKRRLNVLHSRRKRERRKIEAEVISDQVDQLEASNKRLAEENQRFEAILDGANARVAEIESGRYREGLPSLTNAVTAAPSFAVAPSGLVDIASDRALSANDLYLAQSAQISQQPGQQQAQRMLLTEQLLLRESLKQQSVALGQQSLNINQQSSVQLALAQHSMARLPQTSRGDVVSSSTFLLEQQILEQRLRQGGALPVSSQHPHTGARTAPVADRGLYAALRNPMQPSAATMASTHRPMPSLYTDNTERLRAAASLYDTAYVPQLDAQARPPEPQANLFSNILDLLKNRGAPDPQGDRCRDDRRGY